MSDLRISLRLHVGGLLLAAAVTSHAVGGSILFVDDDAPADGDGMTWDTAYRFLQDALADAAGGGVMEIRVGQGTYEPDRDEANPDGTGDREATFQLIDGVALIGGYAGVGAKDPDARDIDLYETILSGDLLGNDLADFVNNEENSYHVLVGSFTSPSSRLEGFTITKGNATALPCRGDPCHGGGMLIDQGSPTIADCTFREGFGRRGGAISILNESSVLLKNCVFIGNAAGSGGAILANGSEPKFVGCIFDQNSAIGQGPPEDAGAVLIGTATMPTFVDCVFSNNSATRSGGAIYAGTASQASFTGCLFLSNNSGRTGGAVSSNDASSVLVDCMFLGNYTTGEAGTGSDGGGFHHDGTADPPPVILNCVFSGNMAFRAGGGLANDVLTSPIIIFNTTISNNIASVGGGVSLPQSDGSSSILINSVIAGNVATNFPGTEQIFLDSEAVINFCCIEGIDDSFGGEGNIGDDPLFIDPLGPDGMAGTLDDDVRLQSGSPCIDAADNSVVEACSLDIDSALRRHDDPNTRDTGSGRPPIVDMGAYEFASPRNNDDCNQNGMADSCEITEGISEDCNANGVPDDCDIADGLNFDCNLNGIPDECDIADGTSNDDDENGIPDECELDCNNNGVPDVLDILDGTSEDCNDNGIPDECDIADGTSNDDDDNGIPDECELDCNNNGVPDIIDILDGTSEDCNDNNVPDECDVVPPFVAESGELGPIGFESPQTFTILDPPAAVGDAILSFSGFADLLSMVEFIDVDINGVAMGSIFVEGAQDCPKTPDADEIIIPVDVYNDAVGGGDAVITMTATNAVNPLACDGQNYITVAIDYSLGGMSDDDNNNGIPDECEMPGDLNGDGTVGVDDLLILLGDWGPCADCDDCVADLDGDCGVGVKDLLILLGNWG